MLKNLELRKSISIGILFAFLGNGLGLPPLFAQDYRLPAPGVMVRLSPVFKPPILKGIKVRLDNPFRFDFILDRGDSQLSNDALKDESSKLIKYFLASLTIPENDLWVNLSPYEKDRIIPQSFGLTEMGRDLLAEDYMLKQITASLIFPEDAVGKKFWKRIYEEAAKKYGTTNIPVDTFNKVWIVPEKAVVYENAQAGTAYIIESKLKVMLEEDYLAFEKNRHQPGDMALAVSPSTLPTELGLNVKALQGNPLTPNRDVNVLGSRIVREVVIPELTKEVNENKNFSHLRQVYNSLILATWYKKKIKDSIWAQVYEDKRKTAGIEYGQSLMGSPEHIYQRYLQSFKKGVFNYIKEEEVPTSGMPGKEQGIFPRKYFSGGENYTKLDFAMIETHTLPVINEQGLYTESVRIDPAMALNGTDKAALSSKVLIISGIVMSIMLGPTRHSSNIDARGPSDKEPSVEVLTGLFQRVGSRDINDNELNEIGKTFDHAIDKNRSSMKEIIYQFRRMKNLNGLQRAMIDGMEHEMINDELMTSPDFIFSKAVLWAKRSSHSFDDIEYKQAMAQAMVLLRADNQAQERQFLRMKYGFNSKSYRNNLKFLISSWMAILFYEQSLLHHFDANDFADELLAIANEANFSALSGIDGGNHSFGIDTFQHIKNWQQFKAVLAHEEGHAGHGALWRGYAVNHPEDIEYITVEGYDRPLAGLRHLNPFHQSAIRETFADTVSAGLMGNFDQGWFNGINCGICIKGEIPLTLVLQIPHGDKILEDLKKENLVSMGLFGYVKFEGNLNSDKSKIQAAAKESYPALEKLLTQAQEGKLTTVDDGHDASRFFFLQLMEYAKQYRQPMDWVKLAKGLKTIEWKDVKSFYDFTDLLMEAYSGKKTVHSIMPGTSDDVIDIPPQFVEDYFKAMAKTAAANGGIDLSSDKALIIQNNGQGIKFHIDPIQFQELQNIPGFVPVIINIQPMINIRGWLGLNEQKEMASMYNAASSK